MGNQRGNRAVHLHANFLGNHQCTPCEILRYNLRVCTKEADLWIDLPNTPALKSPSALIGDVMGKSTIHTLANFAEKSFEGFVIFSRPNSASSRAFRMVLRRSDNVESLPSYSSALFLTAPPSGSQSHFPWQEQNQLQTTNIPKVVVKHDKKKKNNAEKK